MNKSIGIGLVLVVLAGVAGAVYYVTQNLDGFVKSTIEQVGSDATNTSVRVNDVKISLTEGSARLGGLTVANPVGFSQADLFTMSDIRVAIDTASLTRDVYIIKEISVDGPSILVEQQGSTTNIQTLRNNMDTGAGEPSGSEPSDTPSTTRLAVNEINFTNGTVLLKSDVLGEQTLPLPNIALRDIGSAEQGLTPTELGQAIAGQLIGQVRDVVSAELKRLAREEATRKLKEKLGESASEGINKLKGLFGGKDEDGSR